MRLPFFNRRSATGPINVRATPVAEAAPAIKAITSHALPDLGDYRTEFPEALPAQMRKLPWVFWTVVIAVAGWSIWLWQQNLRIADNKRTADRSYSVASASAASLKAQLQGLIGKQEDLQVLSRWVAFRHPLRGPIAAIVVAAADKVQIRSLDIKRRDPNVLRFSVQISCSGTRSGFDSMRQELLVKLDTEGWVVTEAPPDPDDARLIFDAILSRKAQS